ncbi:interferon lambda receptor 1-like [Mantella aurantiaca]
MHTLQEWTLLVIIGILDCVTGQLHKPLNITTESRNFSLFLTWQPASENPRDVTYTVSYKLHIEKRWHVVRKCERIFSMQCDLTCVLSQNYSNQYAVRVKAESSSQEKSAWALLYNISYMFTVDPSPPNLQIILGEGTMTINTSIQTPPCMPTIWHFYLKYLLEIRNINNPAEQTRKIEMTRSSETIQTDGYEGYYCMTAKTQFLANKTGEPSNNVCHTFTQKDQTRHFLPLVGLPVILSGFLVTVLVCIFWYKTNGKARIPKVLDFSHKRYALAVSVIPEVNSYPLNINKNMDQTSSATFLICSEDSDGTNEYPLSGCGYTERKSMAGNTLRGYTHYEDSTSDEYMSSKGLPSNSSNDKSSDSSCIQTSGSNTAISFMLHEIKLHNQSEDINTNVSGNLETLVTNTTTLGPLLDTLCVSDSNNFSDVLLNTLCIAAGTDQCIDNESFECHFTDSEDSDEQFNNDCTYCDMPESYMGSQPLQKNCSSGYEQRGYMSRR